MGRLSCIALQAPLVPGILQARILEWVAIPDLPDPGMEPKSPVPQAVSLLLEPPWKPWTTWVGLQCHHVYPWERSRGRFDTQRKEEAMWKQRMEIWRCRPRRREWCGHKSKNANNLQKLRKQGRVSPRASEGRKTLLPPWFSSDTDFKFIDSRMWENKVLFF